MAGLNVPRGAGLSSLKTLCRNQTVIIQNTKRAPPQYVKLISLPTSSQSEFARQNLSISQRLWCVDSWHKTVCEDKNRRGIKPVVKPRVKCGGGNSETLQGHATPSGLCLRGEGLWDFSIIIRSCRERTKQMVAGCSVHSSPACWFLL